MWRVLLLHYTPHPRAVRLTTQQHLEALERVPGAEVLSYNAVNGAPPWLRRLRFDAVVMHTTLLCMRWNPWFEQWKRRLDWLADLGAVKVAFPQDEYDHADVLDEWLDELGFQVVCTVLDETHRAELYPRLHGKADFIGVLTGYIDDKSAQVVARRLRPHSERKQDLVYRARNLPYWFGSHGQLKHRIGELALERAALDGLRSDISTRPQQAYLGDTWLDFLASGRATIGTESGSSALDRRGELRAQIEDVLNRDPSLSFEEVSAQLPPGWDDYRFFAVSPRHLEAVVTQTAQILVEGRYSGVLEPERHYLPVQPDLSDLDEALERVKDPALTERLASQAFEDVYRGGSWTSQRLTDTLGRILADHRPRGRVTGKAFHAAARVAEVQAAAERLAVAPVTNVLRVGREGYREMLAGLRVIASDPHAGRLLFDYLRSTQAREHVSPRGALADLFCLSAIRRGQRSGDYQPRAELDLERRQLVLRTYPEGEAPLDGAPSADELAAVIDESGWEFLWDHSRVANRTSVPLIGRRRLELQLPGGPHRLASLDWIARTRPRDVAAALAPLVRRA